MAIAAANAPGGIAVDLNVSGFRAALHARVAQRLEQTAEYVAAGARRYAPVDTGALLASIGVQMDAANLTAYIYAAEPYAIFAEFGTRFWAGQPFLRPGLSDAAPLWGGGALTVSIHAAAVVSLKHGGSVAGRPGGMRPVPIPGTANPRRISRKQIGARKTRNNALARRLKGVTYHYHGERRTARTTDIPQGALPFRAHVGPRGIEWQPD